MERTLSIIKPDGVAMGLVGEVIRRLEKSNFKIIAIKMIHMTKAQAEGFYAVHKERPFFGSLTDFMSSGPAVMMVLEGEDAITKNREIMGATNPAEANEGTLRKLYAKSLEANAVHGSDSKASADREVNYFFDKNDVCDRF